jgi:hypothetical protein
MVPGDTIRSNQALNVLGGPKLYSGSAMRMVSAASTSSISCWDRTLAAACSGVRSSGATNPAKKAVWSRCGTGSAARSR